MQKREFTGLRAEAHRRNDLLHRRLDILIPQLLAETGVDCWLLIGREYAEGPVLATMLPSEWISARRRTILILTADQRTAVSRYDVGSMFESVWNPEDEPDQWHRLAQILLDIDPSRIGVAMSTDQAHADGLTATEYQALIQCLPEDLRTRVVSAALLGIRWLETRLPEERATLEAATEEAHRILRRGLSTDVVVPGVTTTNDLAWWYRQEVSDAGFDSWFHPTVAIQRANDASFEIIDRGDLVHVDFGIVHQDMCTDQQEHAYVLDRGETAAPEGLHRGIADANRVQDILLDQFLAGRTGNEILSVALERCESEGLDASIYTHSIGLHGHGAGMTIGLWDQQSGVRGLGDHPLHGNTAYSIELMTRSSVPEWGGASVRFMLEQDAWFDGEACSWLDGRQEELWLI
jgi:Xaa-Pro aminopeptidase